MLGDFEKSRGTLSINMKLMPFVFFTGEIHCGVFRDANGISMVWLNNEETNLTNPKMYLSHSLQYNMENGKWMCIFLFWMMYFRTWDWCIVGCVRLICYIQYIPRNMHSVFALLCFVVVIHWLIFPYPSGLLHWHCGNLTIAPMSAKQPWWIWINTSFEFIMNDSITTTKQSTTKPCAYFLGYTVHVALIVVI